MQERRAHRRYKVSLSARAAVAGTQQIYEGTVTDISFSGVRFVCEQQIAPGEKLDLTLSIELQDVTLNAVVVWSDRLEDLEGIQHGMKVVGVAIVGDRKQLEAYFKKIQG